MLHAHAHFLGAYHIGRAGEGGVDLNGEVEVGVGAILVADLHSLTAGDIAVQELAGAQKLTAGMRHAVFRHMVGHILRHHLIGEGDLLGGGGGHRLVAKELHAHGGNHSQHNNNHGQIDEIELAKEPAFFVHEFHKILLRNVNLPVCPV